VPVTVLSLCRVLLSAGVFSCHRLIGCSKSIDFGANVYGVVVDCCREMSV
jgi:hypothetical protein